MATNVFTGDGNLGSDPNLKTIPSGDGGEIALLTFSMRVSVDRKNKDTGEYEDALGFWATVEWWGKPAEAMAPLLQKGARVLVVGELGVEEWLSTQPATQGQKMIRSKIRADWVAILPWGVEQIVYRPKAAAQAPADTAQPAPDTPAAPPAVPEGAAPPAGAAAPS